MDSPPLQLDRAAAPAARRAAGATEGDGPSGVDPSAIAWVHDELRRTLEASHKLLRRFLRESEAQAGSDVSARDLATVRQARAQIHQSAGALAVVGQLPAAQVLDAADGALRWALERPARLDAALLEKVEQASFAVVDYLGRMVAGKPVPSLLLFPQTRALLEAAGAERVHPADLWDHVYSAHPLPPEPGVAPRAADAQALAALEQATLATMKAPGPESHAHMSTLCAELAAGEAQASARALWQIASAVFEAQAVGLLRPDVFVKRAASRLLAQLRATLRGTAQEAAQQRLAHDLLYFCAQVAPADAARAPRVAAVRAAHGLQDVQPIDVEHSPLGRFDPALVVQARKRVAAAKDSWSAVAAGDPHRLAGLVEQFSLVGDSLRRLFPDGGLLAEELQQAIAPLQRGGVPPPALAMEVATGLLYVEAALEEADFAAPDGIRPIARLAERLAGVHAGGPPQPLDPWMEALYARVSDRQTLGSVVQELRAALASVEQQLDQYFRNPHERGALLPVPALLQSLRGVLSVLGVDHGAAALRAMREEVEALASGEGDTDAQALQPRFQRLAGNLGALGFLIDLLGVQAPLAAAMFRFDAASGVLAPVTGRGSVPEGLAAEALPVLEEVLPTAPGDDASPGLPPQAPPAPPVAAVAAPAAAPVPEPGPVPAPEPAAALAAAALPPSSAADDEMRGVFLEEAREVLAEARAALRDWHDQPDDGEAVVRLRRAFHTLKGSARMVGLDDFGTAAWEGEQRYNARLAEPAAPADRRGRDARDLADVELRHWTADELGRLAAWAEHLADGGEGEPAHEDELLPDFEPTSPGGLGGLDLPPLEALAPVVPRPVPAPEPAFAVTAPGAPLAGLPPVPPPLPPGAEALFDLDLDLEPPDGPAAIAVPEVVADEPPLTPQDLLPSAVPEPPAVPDEPARVEDVGRGLQPPPVPALAPGMDLSFLTLDLSEPAEAPDGATDQAPAGDPAAPDLSLPDLSLPDLSLPDLSLPEPMPADGTPDDAALVRELALDDPALAGLFDTAASAAADGPHAPGDVGAAVPQPAAAPEPPPAPRRLPDGTLDLALDAPPPGAPDATPIAMPDAVELEVVPADLAAEVAQAAASAAAAHPPPDAGPAPLPPEENVRVIGDLRVPIPLFNIYLNEADELSRGLCTDLAEWMLERHVPLPDGAVERAHSLAGSSATVGYTALCELARALEHALVRTQAQGRRGLIGSEEEGQLFVDVAEEIRRLLHQFAAGFLKQPSPELVARLAAHEQQSTQRLQVPVPAPETDWLADIGADDRVDADLFPIFEEEGQDLLPQLAAALRDWAGRPAHLPAADAAMRHLHTFKGGARLAGAMRLGELAHRLETRIERLATSGLEVQTADVEALLGGSDALQQAFEELRSRDAAAEQAAEAQALARAASPAVVPAASLAGGDELAATVVMPLEELPEARLAAAPAADTPGPAAEHAAPASADAPHDPPAAAPEAQPVVEDAGPPAIDWARFDAPHAVAAPTPDRAQPASQAAVRVRAALLERMVNQAGEVNLSRARIEVEVGQVRAAMLDLTDNLERLRQQLRDIELQAETQMSSRIEATKAAAQTFDPLEFDRFTRFQELTRMMAESVNDVATVQRTLKRTVERAEDELAAQTRLTRELQADLLRTRMVEFDTLAERLYRVVRQAAKETGRQARLEIEGGGIELDRGMLERLTPAFEHLLRNAVIHGIEPPPVREAAGKPPGGTVALRLQQHGNEVAIDLQDDGGGLDLARIRAKAEAQGLPVVDGEEAELIFSPGFSTAERLSELAGRGVGLDVVRTDVMSVGGRVEVSSEPGRGTCFALVLPLTTAVTQVLMLRCGDLTVAVPSTLVERVRRVDADELARSQASGTHAYGEHTLPFHWFGALLQHSPGSAEPVDRTRPVLIVHSAQQRLALQVDEVLGHQEAVVRPLGPQLSQLPGLAGMSVLASGTVALIYHPLVLAAVYGERARAWSQGHRAALAGRGAAASAPASPALHVSSAAPLAPLVLVVDDSLTVRRVTQRLLVREGYRVQLAKDGLEALERIGEERPRLVLSDIEMPRMDGFDLVRRLRADAALAELPVVMISSRTAQKHRDHAASLGIDHYLGKPYAEDELLGLVARYTRAAD